LNFFLGIWYRCCGTVCLRRLAHSHVAIKDICIVCVSCLMAVFQVKLHHSAERQLVSSAWTVWTHGSETRPEIWMSDKMCYLPLICPFFRSISNIIRHFFILNFWDRKFNIISVVMAQEIQTNLILHLYLCLSFFWIVILTDQMFSLKEQLIFLWDVIFN
jgi:hypothetical protein